MLHSGKKVLIAGATGYLGQRLIKAYAEAGHSVRALARAPEKLRGLGDYLDDIFVGEATKPVSVDGCCDGIDLVVSALGVTRQKDGLTYEKVDYDANRNLLDEAMRAGVQRFTYIHVLNAEQMPGSAMARAKARFASELHDAAIASTIIRPSGFFSDLMEILQMAQAGRVYLFGDGQSRISPIDGSDLAILCVRASQDGREQVEAGGPETFTQDEIARLAFHVLNKQPAITHIPLCLGNAGVALAKLLGFRSVAGPFEFFLSASALDMSAPPNGERLLKDAFQAGLI
jgi:uncharacterized protein YbjT (DUF2867 family)